MEIAVAQKCIVRERARWLSRSGKISDIELMQCRERLFNRLTMLFALAALVAYFPVLPIFHGRGNILATIGCAAIAYRCSEQANRCRDVLQFLEKVGVANLNEMIH